MKKINYLIIIIAAAGSLQCSSGAADNGDLKIYNDCNRTIRVYYEREYESGSEEDPTVETTHEVESISSDAEKIIEISSDITFEGSIEAVYGGIVKQFDIDFDIFDTASIHIDTNDFYGEVFK